MLRGNFWQLREEWMERGKNESKKPSLEAAMVTQVREDGG